MEGWFWFWVVLVVIGGPSFWVTGRDILRIKNNGGK